MELQVCPRARGVGWYCVEHDGWRRLGVQIYGPRYDFHADEERAGILGMVGSECGDAGLVTFGKEEKIGTVRNVDEEAGV